MNKFKFRAYIKKFKEFTYSTSLEDDGYHWGFANGEFICYYHNGEGYFDEIVEFAKNIDQFTGFYDTYGKDIYVGDIVKYGKHLYKVTEELATPSLVRLDNDYIDYDDFEHSPHDEWYGQTHDYVVALYDIACNMSVIDDNLDCEIIGNIYENKEELQDE